MGLSVSAYARHRGVSHVAVLKAIKSGRINKETDGSIDPDKADAAWASNTNQAQQRTATPTAIAPKTAKAAPLMDEAPAPVGGAGPGFAQSRAIREAYNARLAKLAFEEKTGTLVRTDSVKVAWFNVLRILRDRALNLPDRLSPLLAAEADQKIIRETLDNELRQILNDAADAVLGLNANT